MSIVAPQNYKPDIKLKLDMGSGGVAHLLVRQSEGGGNGDVVMSPLLRIGGEGLTPREGLVLSELPPSAPATASPSCSSFSPM